MQGYLGPETIESIQPFVHREVPWACHTSIMGKPTMKNGLVDTSKHGSACVGAVICATKSAKAYRGGPLRKLQLAMKDHPAVEEILSWWEFVKYHTLK